jgi:hypothetical protein
MVTLGGTAKSTSSTTVLSFMLLCIRFVDTALLIGALASIPPIGSFGGNFSDLREVRLSL